MAKLAIQGVPMSLIERKTMEKKYRLLDLGESWGDVAGVEMLTVSAGWRSVIGYGTVQAHTVPMRRPDDGKGKYLLCGSIEGTAIWKWGVGWVTWDRVEANLPSSVTIWRRPREVEKPAPKEAPRSLWMVVHTAGSCEDYTALDDHQTFASWQEACDAAKHQARINGDGAEFCVCHIDRTFRCEVSVVEREVES